MKNYFSRLEKRFSKRETKFSKRVTFLILDKIVEFRKGIYKYIYLPKNVNKQKTE